MTEEYLTADELGISCEEYCALHKVKRGLESGEYVHVSPEIMDRESIPEGKRGFNLSTTCKGYSCGTVGCIGGWVAQEMGLSIFESGNYVERQQYGSVKGMKELYYPKMYVGYYGGVTPRQAAQAIGNFLSTGKPNWRNTK